MIGKVMIGKSFAGCVKYNVEKQEAEILDAVGLRTESSQTIIQDLNMQRKLNPDLGQAVGHIALSWSIHDKEKLNKDLMVQRAREYLDKMKIKNTQYLIVQHKDKEHPHIHIVYNRIDNEGKTISDQFQKQRNIQACKELTLKYGYYMAANKSRVNRQQLKGADQIKYQLYDDITKAVRLSKSWPELEQTLNPQGIGIQYKYKSGSDEIQGVSFSKNNTLFKGSQIDRSLSFENINKVISENINRRSTYLNPEPTKRTYLKAPEQTNYLKSPGTGESLLEGLLSPTYEEYQPLINEEKRKRKRRGLKL